MARVPLTQQDQWQLVDAGHDVRGFIVMDPGGVPLGHVSEMIVDTRAGLVDAIILDDGAEIPATQFVIERGRVQVLSQPVAVPGLGRTPPAAPADSSASGLASTSAAGLAGAPPFGFPGTLRDAPAVAGVEDPLAPRSGVDLSVFASPTRLRPVSPSDSTAASTAGAEPWPEAPSPAATPRFDPAELTQRFDAGETIRMPVVEEELSVTREPRVVEEVEISRLLRPSTREVKDTIRREQLDLDERWGRPATPEDEPSPRDRSDPADPTDPADPPWRAQ